MHRCTCSGCRTGMPGCRTVNCCYSILHFSGPGNQGDVRDAACILLCVYLRYDAAHRSASSSEGGLISQSSRLHGCACRRAELHHGKHTLACAANEVLTEAASARRACAALQQRVFMWTHALVSFACAACGSAMGSLCSATPLECMDWSTVRLSKDAVGMNKP